MKFIHLSDLHLGKRVNGFSMLDDQEHILLEIQQIVNREKPDAVLIAGDVYDKPVPPAEAVKLFDDFLVRLAKKKLQVFVISGNHDSAERIAFGGRLMDASGIHMAPVFGADSLAPITLAEGYGPVNVFLLPFIKPAHVRSVWEEEEAATYTDAMRAVVSRMPVDPAVRNVLVAHQFVTGAMRSESEEITVGGLDNVDAEVFAPFDYVALGHIHRPQDIVRPRVRYCGTPLKYSFSEKDDVKCVTVVEMAEKGSLVVRTVPLKPKRDLREVRGAFDELMHPVVPEGASLEDYVHAILTDEEDVPDAVSRLRAVYPNLMKLDYDNTRTRYTDTPMGGAEDTEKKTEIQLFEELYEKQNGQPMSDEQRAFSLRLLEQCKEETK